MGSSTVAMMGYPGLHRNWDMWGFSAFDLDICSALQPMRNRAGRAFGGYGANSLGFLMRFCKGQALRKIQPVRSAAASSQPGPVKSLNLRKLHSPGFDRRPEVSPFVSWSSKPSSEGRRAQVPNNHMILTTNSYHND